MTGATGGKRAGSRRGPRRRGGGFQPALLLMALGITACIVAWGYLVVAAVDFGSTARGGDQQAWWFLAMASVGAVACLFVGLMLVSRVLRRLGITQAPEHHDPTHSSHEGAHAGPHHQHPDPDHPDQVRPVGGRRAAR